MLTGEQEELRRVTRRFLEQRSPEAAVRAVMAESPGVDRPLWRAMARELDLVGLALPPEHGGAGATWQEVCIVIGELGRSLACVPYLSTVCLAAPTLLRCGDGRSAALLASIAAGDAQVTAAYLENRTPPDPGNLSTVARRGADGFVLSGRKRYVLDGSAADVLIVLAATDAGPSLFLVEAGAAGLERLPLSTLDQTRRQADCSFQDCPGELVGAEGDGWAVLSGALDLALVALSAESVGGAERCLEMAVEYAQMREQFGRPIGSFQAIKHKCADVYVGVELARAGAEHAALRASEDAKDLGVVASMAKSFCGEVFLRAAKENIQIHGGIGYTWDHPAHLYLKRAKTDQVLFGDAPSHRRRVAAELGL